MKREAKYTLFSGITHIVLLSLLALGSAFVSTRVSFEDKEKVDALPVIHQIPNILVDEAIYNAGGAQEVVQTPVVSPQVSQPQVQPAPPVQQPETKVVPPPPEKVIKEVKEVKPPKNDKPVEKKDTVKTTEVKPAPKKTVPKTVDLDSMLVTQDRSKAIQRAREAAAREAAAEAAQEAAEAEAAARAARISEIASNLKGSIDTTSSKSSDYSRAAASATVKGANAGTGDGTGIGPAVANYKQAIRSIYNNAWSSPSTLTDSSLRTIARITIRRDGTVTLAKITQFSGDNDLDASVKRTIESIHHVPPFPKNSTDSTRTYMIGFNLKGADF